MSDDADLLRQYASDRSEAAFAALVRQHLGLVYHTALRHLDGDAHAAEDVAQLVFTDLARKASSLSRRESLAGWLHNSARYAALHRRRADRRRLTREERAHAMQELNHPDTAPEWARLRPVIDDALLKIPPRDREAVLLHYFEGLDYPAVGARLGLTTQGARSLLERAVEKLQPALVRRGVTSTTTALMVVLAVHAISAPPSALAATVASGAMTAAEVGPGWLGFLTGKKIGILIGTGLLVFSGAAYFQGSSTLLGLISQAVRKQQESPFNGEPRPTFVALMEGIGEGVSNYTRGTKSAPGLANGSLVTPLFTTIDGLVQPGPAVALDLNLSEITELNRLNAAARRYIQERLNESVVMVQGGTNSVVIEYDVDLAKLRGLIEELMGRIGGALDATSAQRFDRWPKDWIMSFRYFPVPLGRKEGALKEPTIIASPQEGLVRVEIAWTDIPRGWGPGTETSYDLQVVYGGHRSGMNGTSARNLYDYWFFDVLKKHRPAIIDEVGQNVRVLP